jgi:hypothetical protein
MESFNADGYTFTGDANINGVAETYVGWSFRRAPKFFDVVTYTGAAFNGDLVGTIAHNLGAVPGMMIVKNTSSTSDWYVWHRSLPSTQRFLLNSTAAAATDDTFNNTSPTDEEFYGKIDIYFNSNNYIAYLFGHDDSGNGFIQCGSYTGNGSSSGPTVNLGWEPQWVMIKVSGTTGDWHILDSARGISSGNEEILRPNLSNAAFSQNLIGITADGFQVTTADNSVNSNGFTYIYMAIRAEGA